ncbi:MAG: hydantoinase B/oxoprolinase family protein [Anaerolineales bacterium]|nr:hydantoinase B/oxoprolinase family protein [Anaerolineales bacterium]
MPDPIRLEIFKHLFASVADEMGVTLGRTGYSPNIKERLDYSCALFTGDGRLLAQAAHIPVHLGAMPASVRAALDHCALFAPGDLVILNDPFCGGTHLPDVTLVSPIFVDADAAASLPHPRLYPAAHTAASPHFFVASRAHHADIGGMSPGSMPLSSEIYQEGVIIPPIKLVEAGRRNEAVWELILRNVRTPVERQGDLAAQMAAHTIGARRVAEIVARYGLAETQRYAEALLAYTERMARALLATIPPGEYTFEDYVEAPPGPDGSPGADLPLRVAVTISPEGLLADFSGTAPAMDGNLNAVLAIVASAAAYVLRCLVATVAPAEVPMNAGAFAPLQVRVPPGSLLDARLPHAVAAGNVETSQRVVDVLLGALAQALPSAVPAASQGTMNNLTFGGRLPGSGQPFAYYETMGGGAGAGPHPPGAVAASGVHVHMSNTRNTPIEALEHLLPVRVERYALRRGSGGQGRCRGGDGLCRDLRFLVPVTATLLTERRRRAPWGLAGGKPGAAGRNRLLRGAGQAAAFQDLPGKCTLALQPGDVLSIETPGGGGWGEAQ